MTGFRRVLFRSKNGLSSIEDGGKSAKLKLSPSRLMVDGVLFVMVPVKLNTSPGEPVSTGESSVIVSESALARPEIAPTPPWGPRRGAGRAVAAHFPVFSAWPLGLQARAEESVVLSRAQRRCQPRARDLTIS